MQDFLYEIGHDTGLATYGEDDVRRNLEAGAVKTLLLSEGLDVAQAIIRCTACDHVNQETVKRQTLPDIEKGMSEELCPKCVVTTLYVAEVKELIDSFAELAEQVGSDVEIISTETEEGVMLKDSFGGVAAILRFKLSS